TADHLGTHRAPWGPHALDNRWAQTGGGKQVICPAQREVTGQNGLADAVVIRGPKPAAFTVLAFEHSVGGGVTSAGIGLVDGVVVAQRTRLNEPAGGESQQSP